MSPLSTIGDFLHAIAGAASSTTSSPEPTIEELNAGGIERFAFPTDSSIQSLKQQLSYEAWLHLLGADSLGVEYNRRLGEREMHQHLVRVIALLDFQDKSLPPSAPAVRARIRWIQRRVLNLGGDTKAKPYYQLMAEGQLTRARKQAAFAALEYAFSPEEHQRQFREIWGDLPPEVLKERALQAKQRQAEDDRMTVAPRKTWDLDIEHPAFAPWFVQELLCREPLEIEAYLNVMWRIGDASVPPSPGDMRQTISFEQAPYVLDVLNSAIADSTGKAQRILKRGQEWFISQSNTALIASNSPPTLASPKPTKLTLRQVALLYAYTPGAVITTKTANAIAKEYGHASGAKLYHHYRTVSLKHNRTGVNDGQIPSMVKDITTIKSLLPEQGKKVADNELQLITGK